MQMFLYIEMQIVSRGMPMDKDQFYTSKVSAFKHSWWLNVFALWILIWTGCNILVIISLIKLIKPDTFIFVSHDST